MKRREGRIGIGDTSHCSMILDSVARYASLQHRSSLKERTNGPMEGSSEGEAGIGPLRRGRGWSKVITVEDAEKSSISFPDIAVIIILLSLGFCRRFEVSHKGFGDERARFIQGRSYAPVFLGLFHSKGTPVNSVFCSKSKYPENGFPNRKSTFGTETFTF